MGGGQPSYDILLRMRLSKAFTRASAIGALAFTLPGSTGAQQTVLKAGATVRFRLGGDDFYRQGQVSQLTADSLIVERCPNCDDRFRYSRAELSRFDVSKRIGGAGRVMTGVLLGGAIGLAGGFVSAETCGGGSRCELAALDVPLFTILGLLVGGVVAYLTSYTWEPVAAGAPSEVR